MHPFRTHRRILSASMVGTAVEFYDFYIYGTAAALVFGPLFFPGEVPARQLCSPLQPSASLFSRGRSALSSSAISAIVSAASRPWSPRF
jgi:hypothetical protein